mgnify:CR=1 FL=1
MRSGLSERTQGGLQVTNLDKLICEICRQETHDDNSEVFEVYYGDGMTQERHCFDCDPPDEEVA